MRAEGKGQRAEGKVKSIRVVVISLVLLGAPKLLLACPVCFGNPNSGQSRGAQAGILALLIVTMGMLASFAGFFFIYLRRRIRLFEQSNGGGY